MKQFFFNRVLGMAFLTLFSFSCASDLDFDQVNDLVIEPVYVANLSYFDIPAKDFVTNGVEHNLGFDAQDFDVFRDAYFRDHLTKAELFFEVNNTINRAYILDVVLLGQNDAVLHTMHFTVPASTGTAVVVNKTEVFENAKLDLLKNTRKLGFVFAMAPGPALTENSTGSLILKSSATVYMTIQ